MLGVLLALAQAAAGLAAPPPPPTPTPSDSRTPQEIRVSRLPDVSFLDPDFDLEATASSGLPVRFSASGDCTVRGSKVHLVSAGRCSITASQPGDAKFQPAPDVTLRLPIGKAEQKIQLKVPKGARYLDPDFEVDASASSGLPLVLVAFGACEVNGTDLHLLGAGRCTVQALQPGDDNFIAAQVVEESFDIARAGQSIGFRLPSPLVRGNDLQLAAASSSGLPVRFEAYGACLVVGSVLRLTGEGSCTVNADQEGNRNFEAAQTVTRTVSVIASSP